jgi:rhodanese-related sulfurtransferase
MRLYFRGYCCPALLAAPPYLYNASPARSYLQLPHTDTTMTTTTTRQSHLIDVRSPVEFATGPLTSDIAPTINIEYTSIASLPSIYAARGINVRKDDDITLYCRSGRRSNIALNTLREMGYSNVRDIGGFEEARRVLDREQVGRQLDREMELMPDLKKELKGGAQEESEDGKKDGKKHVRVQSFNALLEGLKAEDS